MTMCRYRWLERERMSERGLEPCGECEACEPSPPADAEAETGELEQLRADYEQLAGEEPSRRWREPRLRSEIDALRASGEDSSGAGDDTPATDG